MYLRKWFAERGPRFIYQRGSRLLERYGWDPQKATRRIESCLATLDEFGCAPTLPVPAVVVARYPRYFQRLQAAGAELSVHGYQHVELSHLPVAQAVQDLERAARLFDRFDIEVHGFRCPYVACSDELLDALPDGLFEYSSNKAIRWDCPGPTDDGRAKPFFDTLDALYNGQPACEQLSVPWQRTRMIEIPVCLPDDIGLHDGLDLAPEDMAQAWLRMLEDIHRRGELFTLLFHPELASLCTRPFITLLREARRVQPAVWVARLRDVAGWWKEKAGFRVETFESAGQLRVALECSGRATVLARGVEPGEAGEPWADGYRRLRGRVLELPATPRPFVGLDDAAPAGVAAFLREQGYIVDTSDTATRCATYLDASLLAHLKTQIELVDFVESAAAPLVRFGRWPDGRKSALCVTGDLDALTLLDYASRLWPG